MKTNQNHLKETRQDNLLALKKTIDNNSFEELICEDKDWGGAYVIITSSPERVFNPENDEGDWFGRRSSCTYVLTKHSMILSNFFYYVRDNIMGDTDNYLYGFMALLAKDFMKQYGDHDNYYPMLEYLFSGISFYLGCFNWETGMGKSEKAFNIIRFFLSQNTSDEEIGHIF